MKKITGLGKCSDCNLQRTVTPVLNSVETRDLAKNVFDIQAKRNTYATETCPCKKY